MSTTVEKASSTSSNQETVHESQLLPSYCLSVYRVVGRLDGAFYGTEERCCKLVLLQRPPRLVDTLNQRHHSETDTVEQQPPKRAKLTVNHIENLTSLPLYMHDAQFSLPTESPLVVYELLVRQRPSSQSYQILSIESTSLWTSNITKKWLTHHCITHWNLKDENAFKSAIANLPSDNITQVDINRHVFDSRWTIRLAPLVSIASKKKPFFYLLKYFHATVLCKLSNRQIAFMAALLKECPYVFCFRDLLEKILQLPFVFPDGNGLEKWRIALDYSRARLDLKAEEEKSVDVIPQRMGVRDHLLWRPTNLVPYVSTYFNPRHPVLPFRAVEQIYRETGATPAYPMNVIYEALKMYLEFDAFYYGGFPSFLVRSASRPAIELLTRDLHIFVEIENQRLMLQEDDIIESMFSDTLELVSGSIELYESKWYNKEYCRQLQSWISKNTALKQTGLFYTFSFLWETYLQTHCKINFWNAQNEKLTLTERTRIRTQLEEMKKLDRSRVRQDYYILIDHVHKFSVERLLGLVWATIAFLVNERKVDIGAIRLKFIFLGDSEDLPVYHMCGIGDVWSDLAKVFPVKPLGFKPGVSKTLLKMKERLSSHAQEGIDLQSRNETHALAKDMLKKKRSLSNPRLTPVVPISETEVDDDSDATAIIEDAPALTTAIPVRKKNRCVKERNTVHLLCSGKQEQRALSNTLDKVRSSKYNENKFFVRDKVGVLGPGAGGIIKRIYQLNRDGSKTDIGKHVGADLHMATWTMRICPCALATKCECNRYYTTSSKCTIYHNGVDTVQIRQGIPSSFCLFYISKNTKCSHLLAAIKYCTIDFFVFILHQLPFAIIYEEQNLKDGQRVSNLVKKLARWAHLIKHVATVIKN